MAAGRALGIGGDTIPRHGRTARGRHDRPQPAALQPPRMFRLCLRAGIFLVRFAHETSPLAPHEAA